MQRVAQSVAILAQAVTLCSSSSRGRRRLCAGLRCPAWVLVAGLPYPAFFASASFALDFTIFLSVNTVYLPNDILLVLFGFPERNINKVAVDLRPSVGCWDCVPLINTESIRLTLPLLFCTAWTLDFSAALKRGNLTGWLAFCLPAQHLPPSPGTTNPCSMLRSIPILIWSTWTWMTL